MDLLCDLTIPLSPGGAVLDAGPSHHRLRLRLPPLCPPPLPPVELQRSAAAEGLHSPAEQEERPAAEVRTKDQLLID